ncbi:RNA polymerase sigma factor [Amnibacterium endophyticum]|uniref:RNA polymerase sigma factor n=1 Tax=Amnibacterium endophyticum TaxID=2109337 RepID=A0ABW4LH07_9MICO
MSIPFERIVEAHGDVVWRVCRGLLPQHDAEDAWSDTFLAALRAWDRFEGDRVSGWLVTIAHRKALDVLRAGGRVEHPEDGVPDRAVEQALPDLDLWAALARLPAGQRAAVVHHHLAGLPFAEVAELTGTSPAAARKAASDGVRRLRTLMIQAEEDS